MERAAASTSFTVGSIFGLAGLTRTVTRDATPATHQRKIESAWLMGDTVRHYLTQRLRPKAAPTFAKASTFDPLELICDFVPSD
jgi:hypothetical protein